MWTSQIIILSYKIGRRNNIGSLNISNTTKDLLLKIQSYPCTILCCIISSINCQRRSSAYSNLLNKWHKVVGNSTRIFTNVATWMSTNRIKVPQQYDFPFGVRGSYITAYFFNEELTIDWVLLDYEQTGTNRINVNRILQPIRTKK